MSLRAFVLNWLGAKVPEDQMRNIEHPRMEVQANMTMRCMQIGAALGYAYALRIPIMRYLGKPVPPSISRVDTTRVVMRTTRNGLVGGFLASFPLAMAYSYQHRLTDESYYKRAYELRKSRKQLNMDRASLLAGLGTGAFYKYSYGFPLSLGFSVGFSLASIGVFLFNNYDWLYRKAEQKVAKNKLEQLSDKVYEKAEDAKDSLRKVSQQAQDRAEDAKGSVKQAAEDTKGAVKRAANEGMGKVHEYTQYLSDSKANAQENAQDFKNKAKENVNEIKNKAKENATDFKNKAKENVNEIKNKAKENVNDFKNKAKENVNELKNKAKENVNDFKNNEHKKWEQHK